MAELRIRELVDPTVRADRKVAPDRRRRLEGDPFNFPGRRLEAFIRVLGRDARREDVLLDGPVLRVRVIEIQVRRRVTLVDAVQAPHLRHVRQRDAHGHLELRRGQVHARHALRAGVLDLQARVQFQEKIIIIGRVVQVLDGTRAHIPDVLHELLRLQLHVREDVGPRDTSGRFCGRRLLEDLLEAALRRAVAPVQRDGVAVLVADDLDLQVARAGHQLHDEDGRACVVDV